MITFQLLYRAPKSQGKNRNSYHEFIARRIPPVPHPRISEFRAKKGRTSGTG